MLTFTRILRGGWDIFMIGYTVILGHLVSISMTFVDNMTTTCWLTSGAIKPSDGKQCTRVNHSACGYHGNISPDGLLLLSPMIHFSHPPEHILLNCIHPDMVNNRKIFVEKYIQYSISFKDKHLAGKIKEIINLINGEKHWECCGGYILWHTMIQLLQCLF